MIQKLLKDKIFLAALLVFVSSVYIYAHAAPENHTPTEKPPVWVQKPVQCAKPQSVLDRIERDGMFPLFKSIGNARIENDMYTLPYGFFYNPEEQFWLFIEFTDPETACVVGVGQGVDFDVQREETKVPF